MSFHAELTRADTALAVSTSCVLFAVLAMTTANATVFATVGLSGRDVGLSEFQVAMIFVSSAALFLLTSACWGRLADRWGSRPIIAVGLAGTAASLFLFAAIVQAATDPAGAVAAFLALLGARSVYGLLAAGTQPAAIAYMAGITATQARSAGVARVGAAIGLGSIAGPLSVAVLVDLGVAVPLVAGGVLSSLAAVLVVVGMRETKHASAIASRSKGAASVRLASLLLVAFAMHFAFAALQPTNAFYVQDHLGIDTTRAIRLAGLASAAFAACSFVVQAFVVPRLGSPPRRLLAAGLALCLAGLAVCLLAPTYGTLLLGFGLLGVGFGLAQPGLVAAASLVAGERQAEAAGLVQAVMAAAWIAGALAGAALYSLSIAGPLALAVLATVAALLAALLARREGKTGRPDSGPTGPTRLL